METSEIQKYILGDKEIHMMGQYVGVCWNLSKATKQVQVQGETFSRQVKHRTGKAYIDFVSIRETRTGEFYQDDDCPVDGGLNLQEAIVIKQELEAAIEYLSNL